MYPHQAVETCFRKYFVFSSRASRSEFWWWTLFVISGTWTLHNGLFGWDVAIWIVDVFSIATTFPSLAVTVRRLHDTNWSGWWLFAMAIVSLALAPFALQKTFVYTAGGFSVLLNVCSLVWIVLFLTLLVRMCKRGDAGTNRFGLNPMLAAADPKEGLNESILP